MNISDLLYVPSNCTYEITNYTLGYGEALFFSLCILLVAAIFHEFGHYLYTKNFNKDAKIELFVDKGIRIRTGPIYKLNKERLRIMYFYGIFAGFIPIIIASTIHQFYILIIPAYIVGCFKDIQEIYRLRK